MTKMPRRQISAMETIRILLTLAVRGTVTYKLTLSRIRQQESEPALLDLHYFQLKAPQLLQLNYTTNLSTYVSPSRSQTKVGGCCFKIISIRLYWVMHTRNASLVLDTLSMTSNSSIPQAKYSCLFCFLGKLSNRFLLAEWMITMISSSPMKMALLSKKSTSLMPVIWLQNLLATTASWLSVLVCRSSSTTYLFCWYSPMTQIVDPMAYILMNRPSQGRAYFMIQLMFTVLYTQMPYVSSNKTTWWLTQAMSTKLCLCYWLSFINLSGAHCLGPQKVYLNTPSLESIKKLKSFTVTSRIISPQSERGVQPQTFISSILIEGPSQFRSMRQRVSLSQMQVQLPVVMNLDSSAFKANSDSRLETMPARLNWAFSEGWSVDRVITDMALSLNTKTRSLLKRQALIGLIEFQVCAILDKDTNEGSTQHFYEGLNVLGSCWQFTALILSSVYMYSCWQTRALISQLTFSKGYLNQPVIYVLSRWSPRKRNSLGQKTFQTKGPVTVETTRVRRLMLMMQRIQYSTNKIQLPIKNQGSRFGTSHPQITIWSVGLPKDKHRPNQINDFKQRQIRAFPFKFGSIENINMILDFGTRDSLLASGPLPVYSPYTHLHPQSPLCLDSLKPDFLNSGILKRKNSTKIISRNPESLVALVQLNNAASFVTKRIQLSLAGHKQGQILLELQHQRIARCLGVMQDQQHVYILSEYCSRGDLRSRLDRSGPLKESMVRKYFKEILQGLRFLHQKRIVHRDIKASNILIRGSGVVINDFGCSETESRENVEFKGSVLWMAPEALRQEAIVVKSDIWSLACAVIQMSTGKLPWSQQNFDNEFTAVYQIGMNGRQPKIPTNISVDLQNILSECLSLDWQSRPSSNDLLSRRYFN